MLSCFANFAPLREKYYSMPHTDGGLTVPSCLKP